MIEKIKYINHINEEVEFGESGIYVNQSNIHDFLWDVVSQNDRISSFKKGIQDRSLPVVIKCNTEEEGIAIKNKLFEVCEKDVLAVKAGKLVIGDYYFKCYITGSSKSEYLLNAGYMKTELAITSDMPYWIKETTSNFDGESATIGKNLDYNNDFDFDYSSNMLGTQLVNGNFVPSNFRMIIYGQVSNPEIYIGGHLYSVDVDIEANEYLTIDSIEKTIELTRADGTIANCFNLRNRDSYVFEKIPSGVSNVSTSAAFHFDITLLDERSEPKWI